MTDPLVKRLKRLVSHIEHVQESCKKVADGLIERGDFGTARELIGNSLSHDASKFGGREWEQLNDGVCGGGPEFRLALEDHVTRNPHHPEAWCGIHRMPRVYVLEMVCDWHARAAESGTDLREGIRTRAMPRFGFNEKDEVWKTIEETLGYLLEPRLN